MAKPNQTHVSALIAQVVRDASNALSLGHPAVQRLADFGPQAVHAVLKAMRGPTPPGQHSRDMVEALGTVLDAIAKQDATPLIEVLEHNQAPADPELMILVGALGSGKKAQVVEPLIRALKHKDALVRWSAALSLVRLRTKKAVEPLTAALRDRSPMVQSTVVHALHDSKFYRTAAAIEPLRRIVQNKRIKTHYPGLWRDAQAVLTILTRR